METNLIHFWLKCKMASHYEKQFGGSLATKT